MMIEQLAVDHCPVCGERVHGRTLTLEDLSGRVTGDFFSSSCTCGARWLTNPVASHDIATAYGDDYYSFQAPAPNRAVAVLGRMRQRLLGARYSTASGVLAQALSSLLPGYPTSGTAGQVLDIGCGNGERLGRLQRAGWQCSGVDPSDRAVEVARARDLDVHQARAEQLPFPDSTFDAILMSHSIEHCPEPHEVVREAARVLKPGGHLVITTPNATSPVAWAFRQNWVNWDAPRHYVVFNPGSLSRLLHDHGLEVVSVRGSATGWSIAESVRYLARDRQWRGGGAVAATVRAPATLLSLILNFTRFADEIEVVGLKSTESA